KQTYPSYAPCLGILPLCAPSAYASRMLPPRALLAAAVSCVLFAGCDDQKKPSAGYPGASSSVAQTAPSVARHLGFATRVPADVDVFISGYHLETLLTTWLHEISETKLRERMEETDAGRLDSLDEIRGHIGDE